MCDILEDVGVQCCVVSPAAISLIAAAKKLRPSIPLTSVVVLPDLDFYGNAATAPNDTVNAVLEVLSASTAQAIEAGTCSTMNAHHHNNKARSVFVGCSSTPVTVN